MKQFEDVTSDLRTTYQRGDLDGFFKKMNINPDKIFNWVLDKVKYNQMTPEQRADVDLRQQAQHKAWEAESRIQNVSQREMQMAVQLKEVQLTQTLGRAEVKSMSDAFDARVGRPGAFRDAVIKHGETTWIRSNGTIDLTPEQAIEDFVKWYGNPAAQSANAAGAQQAAAQQAAAQTAQPKVNVIPNVAGRTASPLKAKPKSIEDLKRLHKEMT